MFKTSQNFLWGAPAQSPEAARKRRLRRLRAASAPSTLLKSILLQKKIGNFNILITFIYFSYGFLIVIQQFPKILR